MSGSVRRGRFIVLDGPEGSGKSTQIARLAERLRGRGRDVLCVRDPGATPAGERIREVLLDPGLGHMEPATEMFLYMAARAEMVARVIRPALEAGRDVLCDRFLSSTVVYQGYAGGLDPAEILHAGRLACGDVWPDRVVLVEVDADEGLGRIPGKPDRMELKGSAFHQKVAEGFRRLAADEPATCTMIDGRGSVDEVAERIWKAVEGVLR